jgi:predicted lipid-binding transport protein (Tim44 family)
MNNPQLPPLLASRRGVRGWLQRAGLTLLAITVIALGFFFLTIALVVGALLAAVIAIRVWWLMRKIRSARRAAAPLEGEYTVTERSRVQLPRR